MSETQGTTRSNGAIAVLMLLRRMGIHNVEPEAIQNVDFGSGRIWVPSQSRPGLMALHIIPEFAAQFRAALIAYYKSSGHVAIAMHLERSAPSVAPAGVDSNLLSNTNANKEAVAMSETPTEKPSTIDQALDYGAQVAYWTAAIQLTKRGRALLADVLTQHLKGKARATKRQMVLDLLDGPAGGPIVALLLSGLLPHGAAMIGQKGPKVEHMASILRLHAGVTVASDVADKLFEWVMPAKEAITAAFNGLPDVPPLPEAKRGGVLDLDAERAKAAAR